MRKTTSSEFLEWCQYLDSKQNEFHREDYFFAQIAAEVRRGLVKDPASIRVEDFLIKFEPRFGGSSGPIADAREVDVDSKSIWYGILGLRRARK